MNIVAVSGGADSTALALLLWERGEDFELLFSDTGAELPEVYWLLPRLAKKINKPLHVVSNGSFFQHFVARNYMLPRPRARWCTRLLKQVPQDAFCKQMQVEKMAVGIRADEPRRLNMKPRNGIEFYYPLADVGMDKKDVIEFCKKYDLLNPVYEWRSNVSCFCCFFQRVGDWKGLMKYHPALYKIAEEWERQALATGKQVDGWKQGYSLKNIREKNEQQFKLFNLKENKVSST